MSVDEKNSPASIKSVENVRAILDSWVEALAQVLESMTDQKPDTHWQFAAGAFTDVGGDGEYLWWQQSFQISPEMLVWVAAPKATWDFAGTLTLKAAGLESFDEGEARNTWFEILGQSLSVMARAVGSVLGCEVTCDAGSEQSPDGTVREWVSAALTFGDKLLPPLLLTLSPKMLAAIAAPPERDEGPPIAAQPVGPAETESHQFPATASRTMDLLLDVDLPISISFGKAQLPMKDVLKLTTGSIVELNRSVNDQVEVLVNQCLIARGEVVVVEGNYGVRIQEIASRQERLRSLK